MRLKSSAVGFGLVAAVGGIVAASGGSVAAARAIVSTRADFPRDVRTKISPQLRLPGAVVLARRPTLNEILDIILGGDESHIAAVLRARTPNAELANQVASDLVREGKRSSLDPTLLVAVLLTENPDLEPRATSSAGARGLMQVMPFHAGHWGCASSDLFDIDSNICHGVRILADNLRQSRTLPAALLQYNGCVRGTNTPDCYSYARKVYRHARRGSVGPGGKATAATPFSALE